MSDVEQIAFTGQRSDSDAYEFASWGWLTGDAPAPGSGIFDPDAFTSGDIWINLFEQAGTVQIINNDLRRDPTLESSILISLFTDFRADEIDALPDRSGDLRGWWAQIIGSKLWLLKRSKITPDLPDKITAYIKDSLQWLINDGVAEDVLINVNIIEPSTIEMEIIVLQPNIKDNQLFKYFFNWESQRISKGRII